MFQDRTRLAFVFVLLLALALIIALSVQHKPEVAATPTTDLGGVRTEAVSTFAAQLTATAATVPTATATETLSPTETPGEAGTASTSESGSPTPSCYKLKYLQDVTIPDDTLMTPALVFTKTWQVQNNGTCSWRPGFKLGLVGGIAMGGSPYVLPADVAPGSKVELSIKMVAPTNQTGIIQGTWRMADDGGNRFGDALTVVIVVPNGSPVAPATTPTGTP